MSAAMDDTSVDAILTGRLQVSIDKALRVHGASDVHFVDGTWYMPPNSGNARTQYEEQSRIEGAHFLDIDDIADTTLDLPHMMPPPQLFAAAMDQMKISPQQHVIVYVYDSACPFVHRAWYQFYCCGHDLSKLHVLGGSLDEWKASGGPVDTKPSKALTASIDLKDWQTKQHSYPAIAPRQVIGMEQMRQIIENLSVDTETLVLDARSKERFLAQVPEPRPGLLGGHMPGSKCLFFNDVLDPECKSKLKSTDQLQELCRDVGVQLDADESGTQQRIVATCGSGATACTLAAALYQCGVDPQRVSIYDGSWMEWARPEHENPVVKEED